MMVREQGNSLHLLSVVSPEWVKTGQTISVKRAPTDFGEVNFDVKFKDAGAILNLQTPCRELQGSTVGRVCMPKVILHLPWFVETTEVVADGNPVQITGSELVLPNDTKQVQITWTRKPNTPELSFANAVAAYKAEYRRRYDEWQRTGQPTR
jgi:hypothetical protein